jgi:hypothetical protein
VAQEVRVRGELDTRRLIMFTSDKLVDPLLSFETVLQRVQISASHCPRPPPRLKGCADEAVDGLDGGWTARKAPEPDHQ